MTDIIVDNVANEEKLDDDSKNIIKSFKYPEGTDKLYVSRFGTGGLSGATVYRVIPSGSSSTYIIKVGPTDLIQEEYNNYGNFVQERLRCAMKPIFSKGNGKSGLMETMLDQHNNYIGLSEYFRNCSTMEQVEKILRPIFKYLNEWYDLEKKRQVLDTLSLFNSDSMEEYRKQWRSNYQNFRLVPQQELGFSLFNPIDMSLVPSEHKEFLIGFHHGDLRFQNIFVNEKSNEPKIIDFAKTNKGIILMDFAKMEASVKFELLNCNLLEFYKLEEILSTQKDYGAISINETIITENSNLSLAFKTVELVRQEAGRYRSNEDFKAYQYLLLLQSLKFMGYNWATIEERNRAHISAHLLTMVLNQPLARYVSPEIHVSDAQRTDDFDPFYNTSLRLLKNNNIHSLTLVQRTPSLLFKPESKAEEEFANELMNWGKRCTKEKVYFNYIFSATESGEKYNGLNDLEKDQFIKRLQELMLLEKESLENGNYRFRIECIGDDRRVFSPMILTDKESAIFLAEDASIVRARKVVSMSISNSTNIQGLHNSIKKMMILPQVQSESSILKLVEKSEKSKPEYTISDKEHAMYTMGEEIAKESKERLIIIQRTPSLILGAEPLENKDGDKFKHDQQFIEELMKIARKASRSSKLSFTYLWSKDLTKDRFKSFMNSRADDSIKVDLSNKINNRLQTLKNLEDESYKETKHGKDYTFRIASISSTFLGPLALGDMTVAFLFANTENKALVLRIKSKEISNDIYEKIISERPSPNDWKSFAREIGTL